jgi:predicted nucleotidyltransferase
LYGSYSRNEAKEDSDIDILLVLNTIKNDDITFAKPWLFTKSVDSRIEPYVINIVKPFPVRYALTVRAVWDSRSGG